MLSGFVGVAPVLLMFPRLRRPSVWIAAIWGALLAWIVFFVMFGQSGVSWRSPSPALVALGAMGMASGAVYAVVARRLWRADALVDENP